MTYSSAGGPRFARIASLEEDLMRTRWDMDARERGQYKWSSHWHPDVADAGRYGLQAYYDAHIAPGLGPDEKQHQADLSKLRRRPRRANHGTTGYD